MDQEMYNELQKALFEAILKLDSIDDCKLFFNDLCTNKEMEKMAQRVKAAELLLEGKTYHQVIEETEISSATLSRVSRCVQYGTGYKSFIKN
ncbi:MAG: YerC/YecD family TrpR-related protein [Bacillota bacterium]